MDFHAMNRRQLQALCKKHGVPANLKNIEMADRLASIYKENGESVSQGQSPLSNLGVIPCDDDAKKQDKKVTFSPEDQVIFYEVSLHRRVGRRKSMAASMSKNPKEEEDGVAKEDEKVRNRPKRTRNNRMEDHSIESNEVEKVEVVSRSRRSRTQSRKEGSAVQGEAKIAGVAEGSEGVLQLDEPSKVLGRNVVRRESSLLQTGRDESNAVNGHGAGVGKVLRRSKRKAQGDNDSKIIVVAEGSEGVLQLDEPSKVLGRNVVRRKSSAPLTGRAESNAVNGDSAGVGKGLRRSKRKARGDNDSEPQSASIVSAIQSKTHVAEVEEESEGDILLEEPPKGLSRQASRRKSVVPKKGKVRSDGLLVEKETRKRVRNSDLDAIEENDNETDMEKRTSVSQGPSRRSRRHKTVAPADTELAIQGERRPEKNAYVVKEFPRRSGQNTSKHNSVRSSKKDEIAAVEKDGSLNKGEESILEGETKMTESGPVTEKPSRRTCTASSSTSVTLAPASPTSTEVQKKQEIRWRMATVDEGIASLYGVLAPKELPAGEESLAEPEGLADAKQLDLDTSQWTIECLDGSSKIGKEQRKEASTSVKLGSLSTEQEIWQPRHISPLHGKEYSSVRCDKDKLACGDNVDIEDNYQSCHSLNGKCASADANLVESKLVEIEINDINVDSADVILQADGLSSADQAYNSDETLVVPEKGLLIVENSNYKSDDADAKEHETYIQEDQNLMKFHDSSMTAVELFQEVTIKHHVDKFDDGGSSKIDSETYLTREEEISSANSSGGEGIFLEGSAIAESIVVAIEKHETADGSHLVTKETGIEKSTKAQWTKNGESAVNLSIPSPENKGLAWIATITVNNPENVMCCEVVTEEVKPRNIQSDDVSGFDEDSQQAQDDKVIPVQGDPVELESEMDGQLCQSLGRRATNATDDSMNSRQEESESKVDKVSSGEISVADGFSAIDQKDPAGNTLNPLDLQQGLETEELTSCESKFCSSGEVDGEHIKAPIEQDQILAELKDIGIIAAQPDGDQSELCESTVLKMVSQIPLKNAEETNSTDFSEEEKLPQFKSFHKATDKKETCVESDHAPAGSCSEKIVEIQGTTSASRPTPQSQAVGTTMSRGENGFSILACEDCSPKKKEESQTRNKNSVHESGVTCEYTSMMVDGEERLMQNEIKYYQSYQSFNGRETLCDTNLVETSVEFESSNENLFSSAMAMPANDFSSFNQEDTSDGLSQLLDLGNVFEIDEPTLGENEDLESDRVSADGERTPVQEDTKLMNLEYANMTSDKIVQEVIMGDQLNESSECNISKGNVEVALKKADEVCLSKSSDGERIIQTESAVKLAPETSTEMVTKIQWSVIDHTGATPFMFEQKSQVSGTICSVENIMSIAGHGIFDVQRNKDEVKTLENEFKEALSNINRQLTKEKENEDPEGCLNKLPEEMPKKCMDNLSERRAISSVAAEERNANSVENAYNPDVSSQCEFSGFSNKLSFNDHQTDSKEIRENFEAICTNNWDERTLLGDILEVSLPRLVLEQLESAIDGAQCSENEAKIEDSIVLSCKALSLVEPTTLNSEFVSKKLEDHEQLVGERSCDGNVKQPFCEDYSATRESRKIEEENTTHYQVTDVPSDGGRNEMPSEDIGHELTYGGTINEHDEVATVKRVGSRNSAEGLNDFDPCTLEKSNTDLQEAAMEKFKDDENSLHKATFIDDIDRVLLEEPQCFNEGKNDASESKEIRGSGLPDYMSDSSAEVSKDVRSCENLAFVSSLEPEIVVAKPNEHKGENPDESQIFTSWEMNLFCENGLDGDSSEVTCSEIGTPKTKLIGESSEKVEDKVIEEDAVQVLEEEFGGNQREIAADITGLKFTYPVVSFEANSKDREEIKVEADTSNVEQRFTGHENSKDDVLEMTQAHFSSDRTIAKDDASPHFSSSFDNPVSGLDSRDLKEDYLAEADVQDVKFAIQGDKVEDTETVNFIKGAVGLNVPVTDHSQPFLNSDVGKDNVSEENFMQPQNLSPEHINTVKEEGSNGRFVKQMNSSVMERKSRTSMIPRLQKKLTTDAMKENMLSPMWKQVGNKTAPKPSSKRRALEDIRKH
ncbi:hypothetical protein SLE2022_329380 [Rubroshorea leprosula]